MAYEGDPYEDDDSDEDVATYAPPGGDSPRRKLAQHIVDNLPQWRYETAEDVESYIDNILSLPKERQQKFFSELKQNVPYFQTSPVESAQRLKGVWGARPPMKTPPPGIIRSVSDIAGGGSAAPQSSVRPIATFRYNPKTKAPNPDLAERERADMERGMEQAKKKRIEIAASAVPPEEIPGPLNPLAGTMNALGAAFTPPAIGSPIARGGQAIQPDTSPRPIPAHAPGIPATPAFRPPQQTLPSETVQAVGGREPQAPSRKLEIDKDAIARVRQEQIDAFNALPKADQQRLKGTANADLRLLDDLLAGRYDGLEMQDFGGEFASAMTRGLATYGPLAAKRLLPLAVVAPGYEDAVGNIQAAIERGVLPPDAVRIPEAPELSMLEKVGIGASELALMGLATKGTLKDAHFIQGFKPPKYSGKTLARIGTGVKNILPKMGDEAAKMALLTGGTGGGLESGAQMGAAFGAAGGVTDVLSLALPPKYRAATRMLLGPLLSGTTFAGGSALLNLAEGREWSDHIEEEFGKGAVMGIVGNISLYSHALSKMFPDPQDRKTFKANLRVLDAVAKAKANEEQRAVTDEIMARANQPKRSYQGPEPIVGQPKERVIPNPEKRAFTPPPATIDVAAQPWPREAPPRIETLPPSGKDVAAGEPPFPFAYIAPPSGEVPLLPERMATRERDVTTQLGAFNRAGADMPSAKDVAMRRAYEEAQYVRTLPPQPEPGKDAPPTPPAEVAPPAEPPPVAEPPAPKKPFSPPVRYNLETPSAKDLNFAVKRYGLDPEKKDEYKLVKAVDGDVVGVADRQGNLILRSGIDEAVVREKLGKKLTQPPAVAQTPVEPTMEPFTAEIAAEKPQEQVADRNPWEYTDADSVPDNGKRPAEKSIVGELYGVDFRGPRMKSAGPAGGYIGMIAKNADGTYTVHTRSGVLPRAFTKDEIISMGETSLSAKRSVRHFILRNPAYIQEMESKAGDKYASYTWEELQKERQRLSLVGASKDVDKEIDARNAKGSWEPRVAPREQATATLPTFNEYLEKQKREFGDQWSERYEREAPNEYQIMVDAARQSGIKVTPEIEAEYRRAQEMGRDMLPDAKQEPGWGVDLMSKAANMTQRDFSIAQGKELNSVEMAGVAASEHRVLVEKAAKQGIVGKGIEDYPDLAKKYSSAPVQPQTPQSEGKPAAGEAGAATVDPVEQAAAQYGWTATRTQGGYTLTNRNGISAAKVVLKGSNYIIKHEGGTRSGVKILSGNKDVAGAVGRVIKDYFYGKAADDTSFGKDQSKPAFTAPKGERTRGKKGKKNAVPVEGPTEVVPREGEPGRDQRVEGEGVGRRDEEAAGRIQEPAGKEGVQGEGIEQPITTVKRKSPSKGTPERESLELAKKWLQRDWDDLAEQKQAAITERDKHRRNTAKYRKFNQEATNIDAKIGNLRWENRDMMQRWEKAQADDALESSNPFRVIDEAAGTYNDFAAMERGKEMFVRAAERQGKSRADAEQAFDLAFNRYRRMDQALTMDDAVKSVWPEFETRKYLREKADAIDEMADLSLKEKNDFRGLAHIPSLDRERIDREYAKLEEANAGHRKYREGVEATNAKYEAERKRREDEERQQSESRSKMPDDKFSDSWIEIMGEETAPGFKTSGNVFYDVASGNVKASKSIPLWAKQAADERPDLLRKFVEGDLPSKVLPVGRKFDKETLLSLEGGEVKVRPIARSIKAVPDDMVKALKSSVSEDDLRPAMTGVYHDVTNKRVVATDGHQMVVVHRPDLDGKDRIIDAEGREVPESYPYYMSVVPNTEIAAKGVPLKPIYEKLLGLEKVSKYFDSPIGLIARVGFGDGEAQFNPTVLRKVVESLLRAGVEKVDVGRRTDVNPANHAMVIYDSRDKKTFGLAMPVRETPNPGEYVIGTAPLESRRTSGRDAIVDERIFDKVALEFKERTTVVPFLEPEVSGRYYADRNEIVTELKSLTEERAHKFWIRYAPQDLHDRVNKLLSTPEAREKMFPGLEAQLDKAGYEPERRAEEAVSEIFKQVAKSADRARQIADGIAEKLKKVFGERLSNWTADRIADMIMSAHRLSENVKQLWDSGAEGRKAVYDFLGGKKHQFAHDAEVDRVLDSRDTDGQPVFRAVAVRYKGKVYEGNPGELHFDVVERLREQEQSDRAYLAESGFVTQDGKFLTRDEAFDYADVYHSVIARESGQLESRREREDESAYSVRDRRGEQRELFKESGRPEEAASERSTGAPQTPPATPDKGKAGGDRPPVEPPEEVELAERSKQWIPEGKQPGWIRWQAETRGERAVALGHDRFNSWKRVNDAIRKGGGKVDPQYNPYKMEEAFHSHVGREKKRMERQYVKPIMQALSAARKNGTTWEDVRDYLYAMHIPEAAAHAKKIDANMPEGEGAGLSVKWASDTMARLNKEGKIKDAYRVAKIVWDMAQEGRDMVRDRLVPGEIVDGWESEFGKHWVSLKGAPKFVIDAMTGDTGQGYDVSGPGVKHRVGRMQEYKVNELGEKTEFSRAKYLIENTMNQYAQMMVRVQKNQVAESMVNLALDNPDPNLWQVDTVPFVKTLHTTVKGEGEQQVVDSKVVTVQDPSYGRSEHDIRAVVNAAPYVDRITSEIERLPDEMFLAERKGKVEEGPDPAEILSALRDAGQNRGVRLLGIDKFLENRKYVTREELSGFIEKAPKVKAHVIRFKPVVRMKNGDEVYEENPLARQARMLYQSGRPDAMNAVLKGFGMVSRYVTRTATGLNLDFTGTNVMRDVQTALASAFAEQGPAMATRTLKNVPSMMRGVWLYDGNPDAQRKPGSAADWARRADNAGLRIEFFSQQDARQLYAEIQREISAATMGKGKAAVKHPYLTVLKPALSAIERLNAAAENATRVAVFKAIVDGRVEQYKRQSGRDPSPDVMRRFEAEGASYGKNITVNFNRRGEWGTAVNSLYAFANAQIGGNARAIEVLKTPRGRMVAAALTAAGMWAPYLARTLGGKDEESGETHYDQLPLWVRMSNIIWPTEMFGDKGGAVKIPLMYGLGAFYATGVAISEGLHGTPLFDFESKHNKGVIPEYLTAMMSQFSPLGSGPFLQSLAPTAIDPIVQLVTNQQFHGGPIWKEQRDYERDRPNSRVFFKHARPESVGIAQKVSDWTGGNEDEGGLIDMHPEMLDFLWDTSIGGLGKFVMNTATSALAAGGKLWDAAAGNAPEAPPVGEEPREWVRNVPVLRRLYSTPTDSWLKTSFYDKKAAAKKYEDLAKLYRRAGDDAKLAEHARRHPEYQAFARMLQESDVDLGHDQKLPKTPPAVWKKSARIHKRMEAARVKGDRDAYEKYKDIELRLMKNVHRIYKAAAQ